MENFLHQIRNIALKSGKTKIAVIGKGDSIKEILVDKLQDFFIINLNDSERILPGDIALFYRVDFYNRIKKNGFKASYYIAPDHLKINDDKHIEVKYKSLGQDSFDHTFDYLQEKEFYLTDFTLLSAIKFLIPYQNALNKPIDVYFLGFDFRADAVNPDDYQMHDLEYKNVFLQTQESVFTALLKSFNSTFTDMKLLHVGEKTYSTISVSGMNRLLRDYFS